MSRKYELNPLSPRASKAILLAAKAWAYVHDRDFILPEDVQAILPAVVEHRMRSAMADFRADGSLTKRLLEQVDPWAKPSTTVIRLYYTNSPRWLDKRIPANGDLPWHVEYFYLSISFWLELPIYCGLPVYSGEQLQQ